MVRNSATTEYHLKRLVFFFQEEEILKCIVGLGVCDGISQKRELSVDGQPFHPVHKDKLQKLLTLAASPTVQPETCSSNSN